MIDSSSVATCHYEISSQTHRYYLTIFQAISSNKRFAKLLTPTIAATSFPPSSLPPVHLPTYPPNHHSTPRPGPRRTQGNDHLSGTLGRPVIFRRRPPPPPLPRSVGRSSLCVQAVFRRCVAGVPRRAPGRCRGEHGS